MFSSRYRMLGARIAYNRKLKGMTQQQLALAVGITHGYLSSIERGISQGMPMSLLWLISDKLEIEVVELFKS